MRKYTPNFLTYKEVVNIVTSLNIQNSIYQVKDIILSRKLYNKLVEHDLIDDCHFDFSVSTKFHSPYPYSFNSL